MINAYRFSGEAIVLAANQPLETLPDDIVWLDLVHPGREEERYLEALLAIEVPTREDLKDIEPSSRLYTEDGAVFMTASLLWRADTDVPELTDIAFILVNGRLVTIRYAEPKSFNLFISSLQRSAAPCRSGAALLAHLLETIIDRTAEILEGLVARLDSLSLQVFGDKSRSKRRTTRYLEERLIDIAGHHRLVGKTRDSLTSLSRVLSFLAAVPAVKNDPDNKQLCRTISRDIQSLSEHASFVAGNITFLLDASLGLINVEQNAIIKIFSIASVVFLPPTLVASIYGMNFQVMPELSWFWGYPASIAVMVVSAIVPFFIFRWKGWL